MEVRKLHKTDKKLDSLLDLNNNNGLGYKRNIVKKVRDALKQFHIEDTERIKALPKLNIVKCENFVRNIIKGINILIY